MGLLSLSSWAFIQSYSEKVAIEGAKYLPIVYDNGFDLIIAKADDDFPEESIEPTLEQLSENLRKGSRSGANVKIKIRKLEKLSNLSDLDINEIQRKSSLCTLNNLKKIRAIAIFKKQIGISPPQAYLLLHCGISSIKSLSLSTPYELELKIGRLERTLRVKTETDITFTLLKEWIKKASQIEK